MLLYAVVLQAQTHHTDAFFSDAKHDWQQGKMLDIRLRNHNFFKNNEYFNDFVYSYTLLGAFLEPTVSYRFSPSLQLSAGLYMQKYSGMDNLNILKPLYKIEYRPHKNLSIIMGDLNGGLNHRMMEQIYRFDRHLIDNDEEGVQLVYNNGRHFADLWLNCDKAAFPKDLEQEQLQIGFSGELGIVKTQLYDLRFTSQVLWAHNGGQDLAVTYQVRSFGSAASGVKFHRQWQTRNVSGIAVESSVVYCSDLSPEKKMPYTSGFGVHGSLAAYYSYVSFSLGYWYGHHYFSALGEPLFQSLSAKWRSVIAPEREVISLKLAFTKEVSDGLKIAVHYGAYYGRDIKSFDYFYGMHLIVDGSVFSKYY